MSLVSESAGRARLPTITGWTNSTAMWCASVAGRRCRTRRASRLGGSEGPSRDRPRPPPARRRPVRERGRCGARTQRRQTPQRLRLAGASSRRLLVAVTGSSRRPQHRAGDPQSARRAVQWIRRSYPAHSFSRSTNFCTFPVEVFGNSRNSTASGHLKWARCSRQNAISSSSVAVCARLQRHERLRPLAPPLRGDRDHGALQHGRVALDHLFDLDRRDVLAARDDDVLLAVAQLDVAVRVHHAEVARVEPSAGERAPRSPRAGRSTPSSTLLPRMQDLAHRLAVARHVVRRASSTTRAISAVTYP